MVSGKRRTVLAVVLVAILMGGMVIAVRAASHSNRINIVALFDNSNGIFAGDDVRILGVPVGKVEQIEPRPTGARITFWVDKRFKVPANADAVILSPALVTDRAIQLTPAYGGGPVMGNNSVIPNDRTAVPVEWDDFRHQLEKLTEALEPSQPGGVSTLGAIVVTAADNVRGQGANIRESIINLSQAISAMSDHSSDIFSTVKNISILVSALSSSTDLMRQLNLNLASVTALLANDPDEVGRAVRDINRAVGDVRSFVADNREAIGTFSDKLSSISTALVDSLDDVEQALHTVPNATQNFMNVYQPAQGSITGVLAINNFSNTITFLCGAIQAAARLGNEQSAKLCVQYLAPIIKNRQYNFPPLGVNPFVGSRARPNEVTYSEDWLRPDFVPPAGNAPVPSPTPPAPPDDPPLAAEVPLATNPADGLRGLMTPAGGG